ncbi:MAG: hypothetical protein NUV52_02290 [Candidatus Roizmanbacteria bacterium]|nr:hypothetical protein [Candidatus Roizmanbacteria bacterium]
MAAFDVVQIQRDLAELLISEIEQGKRTFEVTEEIVEFMTSLFPTITTYQSAIDLMNSLSRDWEVDTSQLIGKYTGYVMEDTHKAVDTQEMDVIKDKLRALANG